MLPEETLKHFGLDSKVSGFEPLKCLLEVDQPAICGISEHRRRSRDGNVASNRGLNAVRLINKKQVSFQFAGKTDGFTLAEVKLWNAFNARWLANRQSLRRPPNEISDRLRSFRTCKLARDCWRNNNCPKKLVKHVYMSDFYQGDKRG